MKLINVVAMGRMRRQPLQARACVVSSSLARSSVFHVYELLGNLAASFFPLFTTQMFARLTHRWGLTLFGCIGAALVPIPWVRQHWLPVKSLLNCAGTFLLWV
jgi:hypothetical protein